MVGLKGTNNKERLHQVLELESQIEKNLEQQNVMVNLMSAGYIEPELYHAERNALLMEADRLNKEKDFIAKSINGDLTHLDEAQKLLRFMAKKTNTIEYEDALIQDYVERVIIQSRNEACFELKCGLKLTERLV
ncbi:hypothetical protein SDC9_121353 [bioreactor metagenome]|uniref:Uncharacterized protein n=1 Tax=bioreactor metagenome TaxID=1076179 RepID=A0A645CBR0_9ZZZZ